MAKRRMEYLRTEDDRDWFYFVCAGCQSEGELGVPLEDGMKPFGCPGGLRGDLCPVEGARRADPNTQVRSKASLQMRDVKVQSAYARGVWYAGPWIWQCAQDRERIDKILRGGTKT